MSSCQQLTIFKCRNYNLYRVTRQSWLLIAPRAPGRLVRPGAGGSKLRSRKNSGREGPKPCQMGPFSATEMTWHIECQSQSSNHQRQGALVGRPRPTIDPSAPPPRRHRVRQRHASTLAHALALHSHARGRERHAQDSLRRRRLLRAHAPPSSRLLITFERQQSRMHEQASAASAEACSYVRKSSCDTRSDTHVHCQ